MNVNSVDMLPGTGFPQPVTQHSNFPISTLNVQSVYSVPGTYSFERCRDPAVRIEAIEYAPDHESREQELMDGGR